jgi:hypothetical protein
VFCPSYKNTGCSNPLQCHFARNFSALQTLIQPAKRQSVAAKNCVPKAHAASLRILSAIACFFEGSWHKPRAGLLHFGVLTAKPIQKHVRQEIQEMRTSNHSDQQQPTATIYQFPVGGRAALSRHPGELKPADFSNYPAVDFGSGWYHDDAIAEERKVEH